MDSLTSPAKALPKLSLLDAASKSVRSYLNLSKALEPNTFDTVDIWGTIFGHASALLLHKDPKYYLGWVSLSIFRGFCLSSSKSNPYTQTVEFIIPIIPLARHMKSIKCGRAPPNKSYIESDKIV